MIVPPVPTPATTTSTRPSVSSQISTAVVSRWIRGFAGFSNCPMIIESGISRCSSSARAIAPFMPFAPSVSTTRAPSACRILRRSTDMVSGMVSTSRMPRAAQTKASAMPVLPEVGSITVVTPGRMAPRSSASRTIASPMRSLTDDIGLKDSSLSTTSPWSPCWRRCSRTSGVWPMVSTMLSWMRDMRGPFRPGGQARAAPGTSARDTLWMRQAARGIARS